MIDSRSNREKVTLIFDEFFLGLTLSLLASCSNDEDFITTNQDSLFSLTSENALKICGGESRILKNENQEIIGKLF